MLDGERYYASFPDENPAERLTELVSRVLLNAIKSIRKTAPTGKRAASAQGRNLM